MAFVPYKKKDKKNDGKDSNRSVPEFKPTATGSDLPLDDADDGDQGPGLARKISALCCLPFLVVAVWAKKAAVASWNGVRWCGVRFGKIGSLFVRKTSDDENGETETPPVESAKRLPQTPSPSTPVSPPTAIDDREFDEDEEKFGWLNVGTKLAALAAIGLLLVGGFYGVKTYLASSKQPNVQPPDVSTPADSHVAPPVVDPGKPPIANQANKPGEKAPEKPPVLPLPKKPDDKPPAKPEAPPLPKKPDDKPPVKPEAPPPPKKPDDKPPAKPEAPPPPKKPDDKPLAKPEAPPPPKESDEKVPEKPVAVVEPPKSDADSWGGSPAANTANPPANSAWDTPVPPTPVAAESKDLATPFSAAPAWSTPDALSSPPIPEPPVASVDPLAPVVPVSAMTPLPEVPENPAPVAPPVMPSVPIPDVEKSISIPDPATALKPLIIPPSAPTVSSFDVTESKPEFQPAPVPPNKDVSLPESAISSLPPLAPISTVSEVVPGIPSSGTVEPIITSTPPTPTVNLETSPGIPEPIVIPESTATFMVPNAVAPEPYVPPPVVAPPVALPVEPLTAFIPPPLASPTPPLPSVSAPSSEDVSVEPAIGIPEPIVPTVVVAPLSSELRRPADPIPPLEILPPSEIPQDRSATVVPAMNAPTFGQPRITPSDETAQNNSLPVVGSPVAPLSMPNDPNDPVSNPLLHLNPSGITPAGNDGPPAKLAVPEPKYQGLQGMSTTEGSTTYRQRAATNSVPDAKRYVIEPGDTYMTISTRFYDTSLLYRALAVHNRRLGVAWLPEPGTEIEIPPQEYLQTNYAEILSQPGERSNLGGGRRTPSSIAATIPVTATTVRQGTRYIVREGDTVFKIAEEKLRDTGRWKDIIQWNSEQLHDARDLRPGMEIVLPTIR